MGKVGADISYNTMWMGLRAFAETGLGIIVSCMLSLPKLIGMRCKVLHNTLQTP
jgi:hypothetical protein